MTKVTSPYNFVPLNKEVYFPSWANLVNHDVPFKDGLSGQIELEITAESPIFIRKPYEVGDEYYETKDKIKISKEFCHIKDENGNKQYYIPGSSLKGEIANVLEIMSFSKLKFFNDDHFSQRDWDNSNIFNPRDFANVKGGWLSKSKDIYTIQFADTKPHRISHNELNKKYAKFSETYSINFDDNNESMQMASHKYRLTNSIEEDQTVQFKSYKFKSEWIWQLFKNVCTFDNNSKDSGTIVFTGQSSKRIEGNESPGKGYEFVFWKYDEKNTKIFTSQDDVIRNFLLSNNDQKLSEQSEDWKMWKKQLENGRKVPVFITLNDKGEIKHFGLSMLYRLLYDNSIKELVDKVSVDNCHSSKANDFVEILFGDINHQQRNLKGRVHFGHAFSDNASEMNRGITTILGSPKASFYPFYIKQNFLINSIHHLIDRNYLTFNDGEITGRKRYPIVTRDSNFFNNPVFSLTPSSTSTTFTPLKEGSIFKSMLSFQNLLPEELGGLLSALTFHGNEEKCRHNIGLAKPLGLGRVKIRVQKILIGKENKEITNLQDSYLGLFEKSLKTFLSNWLKSRQMKELFALATPISINHENKIYLQLDPENNKNEFVDIKKERKALPYYSKFSQRDEIHIKSKIINDSIQLYEYDSKAVFKQYALKIKDKIKRINLQIDSFKENIDLKYQIQQSNNYNELIINIEDYLENKNIIVLTDEQDVMSLIDKMDVIFLSYIRESQKEKFIKVSREEKIKSLTSDNYKSIVSSWFNLKREK